jgi:peptidoglycan hydrolase-like protein with peptidoglycan-binding domain
MKNIFLISEEERNRILGMHLNEQSTQQPVQPQPTSTFKMGVKNDKVIQIQNKLNEKFKAGLVPDGLWGPKTASAVAKYLPQVKQPVANVDNSKTEIPTLAPKPLTTIDTGVKTPDIIQNTKA